jgi:hypothetical protein
MAPVEVLADVPEVREEHPLSIEPPLA